MFEGCCRCTARILWRIGISVERFPKSVYASEAGITSFVRPGGGGGGYWLLPRALWLVALVVRWNLESGIWDNKV